MSVCLQPYVFLKFTHKLFYPWLQYSVGHFQFIVLYLQCGIFCLPVSFLGILILDLAGTCLGLVELFVQIGCSWSAAALWGGICVGHFEYGMSHACWSRKLFLLTLYSWYWLCTRQFEEEKEVLNNWGQIYWLQHAYPNNAPARKHDAVTVIPDQHGSPD